MKLSLKNRLSWWEEQYLLQDIDYVIIGAGIVGLSTACELRLKSPDKNVLVLDKRTAPIGASTKNAGFACFGSISEILDDIDQYGLETCQSLLKMRWNGLRILKNRISLERMRYQSKPGIEIFVDSEEASEYISKIESVNDVIYNSIGVKDTLSKGKNHLGHYIMNKEEGCLNPQLMMVELEDEARRLGVRFLQGMEVENIDRQNKVLSTNQGNVHYKHVVVCTNGFTSNLLPDLDVLPARNQVIISKPIEDFNLDGCYHMNKGYVYFREIGGRLLIGGGRHLDREGETTQNLGTTTQIIDYLTGIAKDRIIKKGSFEIEKTWSGILGVGSNKMPLIMSIDATCTIAVRMGGMGVAIGSYIGQEVALRILKGDNSTIE